MYNLANKMAEAKAPTSVAKITISTAASPETIKVINHVLDNMHSSHGTGLLLAGSTGIGKTTFVKQLGKLLGMKMILIEVPHITEENLINIPFMVFDHAHPRGQKGSETFEKKTDSSGRTYNVVLGRSYLASQLEKATQIPDSQYISDVMADPVVSKIYQAKGGTAEKIPEEFKQIRNKYKVILFLDEYWRQTSDNVRNILRTILNGRIGNDPIPPKTYIIYASNMEDVGGSIERVPTNADFKKVQFPAPTKESWFSYFINKFKDDTKVALKPEVVKAFYAALKDEHISFDDHDLQNSIRTSPRRWEQLLLYVNSNLPITDEQHAAALLSNVHANFMNEIGETSKLHNLVDRVVRQLMPKEVQNVRELESSDWRHTLENQLRTKSKLGDARSYVPVISGPPGIGKTAEAINIAQRMNLRYIPIDCSTLNVEDVTGIPILQGKDVIFAKPSLLTRISTDIEEADQDYLSDPQVSKEAKKAYKDQRYKYLIFFDELSRVSNPSVFNSLRRVILEKSFGDKEEEKLPDKAMVMAAMNPSDAAGVQELTGHMKDAIDVIHTAPSWSKLDQYLGYLSKNSLPNINPQAKEIAKNLVDMFKNTMTLKLSDPARGIGEDNKQFYIKVGDGDEAYISPREYTSMFEDIARGVNRALANSQGMKPDELTKALTEAAWEKMHHTISFVLQDKHQIDSAGELNKLQKHVQQNIGKLFTKKREAADLASILDEVFKDPSKHLADDPDFTNLGKTFNRNAFEEELLTYLRKLVSTEQEPLDFVLKDTLPSKKLNDKTIKAEADLVGKYVYLAREIFHAITLNKMSGDIMDAARSVFRKLSDDLTKNVSMKDAAKLMPALKKIKELDNLVKQAKDAMA